MNFEDELMRLELRAQEAGIEIGDMISAYELRSMALAEEENADED